MIFVAEPGPSKALQESVAALAPANPFLTAGYVESQRVLGAEPWIFVLRDEGTLRTGCTGFLRVGRLSRSLEIPSLPAIPDSKAFWGGLLDHCRRTRVAYLTVNSFASPAANIPKLPGERWRRNRREYLLALMAHDQVRFSSNHERNVKRGRQAGLQVRRLVNDAACHTHALLAMASMARRKRRGEVVPDETGYHSTAHMIRAGAGELFQAVLNERIVSSMLVLRAKVGGYYHSAGTSPEGMACGASHFLVHEITKALRAESMELFNLGGADESNPGLERFKSGFGGIVLTLESAEFFLGNKLQSGVGAIAALLRRLR